MLYSATQVVALLLASSSIFGGATLGRSISPRATVCNGYAELCSKSFGNVTLVGAHDSYAVSTGNVAANQDYAVTTQLNEGIRMLQVQAHMNNGVIHLCHTSCVLLDAGPFSDYLSTVKTWVDSNPNEVISILIVNVETLDPSAYAAVFASSGLDALTYAPPSATLNSADWPTLGELIDQNKRVVVFMDFHADFTAVPYLIDEFSNVWETAYNVVDQTFNCSIGRTGEAGNKMYLINHFLDKEMDFLGSTIPVPNKDLLNETNAVAGTGSLGLQASGCATQYAKNPTFMLVDFYNYGGGSVFQVAADLNSVTYSSSTVSPPITGTSTPSSSGSSSPSGAVSPNSGRVGTAVLMAISGVVLGVLSV